MDNNENKTKKESVNNEENENNKKSNSKSKTFLKFLVKLKRGAFWSERILVLTDTKLMYFKRDGEKRFDEDLSSCKISSEQFSGELKKHTIIISSTNNKFEDIKLINDESNMSSNNGVVTLIKPGLSDFVKEFNQIKMSSVDKEEKLRNTEKFSTQKVNREDISKKLAFSESKTEKTDNESNFDLSASNVNDNLLLKSITPVKHISSSAVLGNQNNESNDIIDKSNVIINENTMSNQKVSSQNTSTSTHIHHMKMDKVIYNSVDIPLTEIFKTFICEPDICNDSMYGSKISSNFNLDLMAKLPKYDEISNLTVISEMEKNINEISANENKNYKSSLVLISGIMLHYLLTTVYFKKPLELFNIYELDKMTVIVSMLLVILLYKIFFSKYNELETRSTNELYKEYKESAIHFSNDATIKASYYYPHSFNTLVDFFKSYHNTKEYMKNLEQIDDTKKEEGLIYSMNNGSKDKIIKFKVKRIAIKRNSLFIIAEYVNNDLLKMTTVEKVLRNEENENENEISFCKVSMFIPINVIIKHKIPETFIYNSLESLQIIEQIFLKNNFNSLPSDLNQITILNKHLS